MSTFHHIFFAVVLWAGAVAGATAGREVLLKMVDGTAPPAIREGKVIYMLDLEFDRVPPNHWLYYSSKEGSLFIDCYGAEVGGPEKVVVSRDGPFRTVSVDNRKTMVSLSGYQSLVGVSADPGWHFRSRVESGSIIRVTAWRYLAPGSNRTGGRQRAIILASAAAVASLVLIPTLIVVMTQR